LIFAPAVMVGAMPAPGDLHVVFEQKQRQAARKLESDFSPRVAA
jgi:hypothetical protein